MRATLALPDIGGLIMNITVFTIAFIATMLGMLLLLALNSQTLLVVKAGKVNKPCEGSKRTWGIMPSRIRIGGKIVDVSKDQQMLVCGNSMKFYRVFDGQRIYVKLLTEMEKQKISTYPVLVFNIVNNPIKNDAQFKLRKFVSYVTTNDWDKVYEANSHRIKISKEAFVDQCASKSESFSPEEKKHLVLSETYDDEKDEVRYSLHPVSTIYGKVEYAL